MSRELRYEIKMVAQAAAYARIRMLMRFDRSAIRTLYPPRRIQSIYFDTWRNIALEENLAGISHREKVRFRWYGEAKTGVKGTLERKVRENMLGWKDLLRIDSTLAVEGQPRRAFTDSLRPFLSEGWEDVLDRNLQPVQWIRYDREYFATEAGKGPIRITIDRNLRTWDQRNRPQLSSKFRAPTPDVMIVEAKCAEGDYDALKDLMDDFPMRIDRCSKFVYASSPNDGALASQLSI